MHSFIRSHGSGGRSSCLFGSLLVLLALQSGPARAQNAPPLVGGPAAPAPALEEEQRRPERPSAEPGYNPDEPYRIVVSIAERRLWLLAGRDTVLSAPVAVGKDSTLSYGQRTWRFATPLGVHYIRSKEADPVWIPPDWHYIERAREYDLELRWLARHRPVVLSDGRRLLVGGDRVILVAPDGTREELPPDEEIIFDRTLFVPPFGTRNRRIEGQLGGYKLALGGGYLIHGTPDAASIGKASTHGCLRLSEEDIRFLYEHVPIGTRAYVH